MTAPAITIGMPVYNGADYLEAAILSVLNQDFKDFELLISEGGSTDGTQSIIEKYASLDSRIRYEKTETRIAQVPNCNRIMDLAKSEWVQFLCHDDVLLPGAVAYLARFISDVGNNVALLSHQSPNWYPGDLVLHNGRVAKASDLVTRHDIGVNVIDHGAAIVRIATRLIFPHMPSLTSAMVCRRKFLDIGGFDADYAQFDTYCWYRLLLEADYASTTAALSLTRIHHAQVTSKVRSRYRLVKEARKFWKSWIQELPPRGFPRGAFVDLIPLFKAGTSLSTGIYITMATGRRDECADLIAESAADELLVAFMLLPRAMLAERRRTARLAGGGIPISVLYP